MATNDPLRFSHHTFEEAELRGPSELIQAKSASVEADRWGRDVSHSAELLRRGGVAAIILVHGTFAGNDIAGVVREVGRFSPVSARRLHELSKHWLDEFVGEVGNFTQEYADLLSGLINPGPLSIAVRRFQWSGENHHLGRADGVMGLVEMIDSLHESNREGGRVLVLAHSHGGNLLAMLSQIIGSDRASIETFFSKTQMHYHNPVLHKNDLHVWQRVRDRLFSSRPFPPIDVATLGTPLRYRWNRRICPHLLHFVQHRGVDPAHPAKAILPKSFQEASDAVAGDYVQHLGIAGTDFLPSFFAWRDWIVERRMGRMFEATARRRDLWRKLRQGRRESCDGSTLLVDYVENEHDSNRKLLGHGVYTCRQWLPFHLREIAARFYL